VFQDTTGERRQSTVFFLEKSMMPVGGGAESGGKPDKAGAELYCFTSDY
jgi:hypothetical protein